MALNIGIINYEMGNIQSIVNALEYLGYTPFVSKEISELSKADAYILPGVGAFGEAMKNLKQFNLLELLHTQIIINKKPILGICLGMQLMCQHSKELGEHAGFGWIAADIIPIQAQTDLRVPHVGWNTLDIYQQEPLFTNIDPHAHFYFDHSFYVHGISTPDASCSYGTKMCVSFHQNNIFGVQFHPEKSQINGLRLLRNFLDYCEQKDD